MAYDNADEQDLAVIDDGVYYLQPGADDVDAKATTLRFRARGDATDCALNLETNAPSWLLDGMFDQDMSNAGKMDFKHITLATGFSGSAPFDMNIISQDTLCKLYGKFSRKSVATATQKASTALESYIATVRAATAEKSVVDAKVVEAIEKFADLAWTVARGINKVVASEKRSGEERALLGKLLQCTAQFVSDARKDKDSAEDIGKFATYLLTADNGDAAKDFFGEGAPFSIVDNKGAAALLTISQTKTALALAIGNYLSLVKKMARGTCQESVSCDEETAAKIRLWPIVAVSVSSSCGLPITVQQIKPAQAP